VISINMSIASLSLENVENSQMWERHQQIKFDVLISQGNISFSKGLYCMENAFKFVQDCMKLYGRDVNVRHHSGATEGS